MFNQCILHKCLILFIYRKTEHEVSFLLWDLLSGLLEALFSLFVFKTIATCSGRLISLHMISGLFVHVCWLEKLILLCQPSYLVFEYLSKRICCALCTKGSLHCVKKIFCVQCQYCFH